MRTGVRLGIDVGTVRIGVARCDASGLLAVPEVTIPRTDDYCAALTDLVDEYGVMEIYLGLPLALSGNFTASTQDAVNVAHEISQCLSLPVRCIDERLTTVAAHAAMRSSGKSQKQSRSVIDQVAAVLILQQALDSERSTGRVPGTDLSEFPASS